MEYGGDIFSEFELPESEIYGLLAAVIILILAFGSVLAMGLPIGTALFGLGIGTALVSLGSNLISMPDFTTAMVAMIGIGVAVMKRASKGLESYFLAGNQLPWYVLGVSNASAMFDITGTMWLVYNIFVYGMKGIWLPWLWPTFNQVFLMVY
ncbi:MAG: hypothetical protein EHM91_14230 [Planctomycetota bacterium]|nr:MAG: hypothetical protein EHM91_14230 [Planctomycetota bacterium]